MDRIKVFYNYSIDCELPPDGNFGGPATWDVAERSTRSFVDLMDSLGLLKAASLFIYPDVAQKQRGLFREMADRGIEIARASRPDVILMDINLPDISGVQVLNILADYPATAGIPVIALSANAMARDIKDGLGAGFFRYLTKPIKVNEFMDTLEAALELSISATSRATRKERA